MCERKLRGRHPERGVNTVAVVRNDGAVDLEYQFAKWRDIEGYWGQSPYSPYSHGLMLFRSSRFT